MTERTIAVTTYAPVFTLADSPDDRFILSYGDVGGETELEARAAGFFFGLFIAPLHGFKFSGEVIPVHGDEDGNAMLEHRGAAIGDLNVAFISGPIFDGNFPADAELVENDERGADG